MEDLIESLTNGNVTEVKVVLASVLVVLAVYQVLLMAVGWGRVKLPFLSGRAASFSHRTVGDAVVVITVFVAFLCIAYFGIEEGFEDVFDDDGIAPLIHVIAGTLLLAVLALKIVVIRRWHSLNRYLPALGLSVFALFAITWITSAGNYFWG